MLTAEQWRAAGQPGVRLAGFIYGTLYYRYAGSTAIYAEAPDDSVHHLTYDEWVAAGKPTPQLR
jgi:hypothetical protein